MTTPPLKQLIFEKIEDSYTLKQDLKDILLDYSIGDEDTKDIMLELIPIIADFVNQNYTPKPNKI